jgi:WD40 repeat protein
VEIAGLAYIPKRSAIAVVMKPSGLRVFDAATLVPANFPVLPGPEHNPVCFVAVDPGYLAARSGDHGLAVRSVEAGKTVAEIPDGGTTLRALRFSGQSGALAAAYREGTVETWDAQELLSGKDHRARRFCAHDGRAVSVDFSPDGQWLASGGEDGLIRLWHGRSLCDPFDVALEDTPWNVLFSPCGRWLAVVTGPAGRPGRVTMFNARTGKRLWTCKDEPIDDRREGTLTSTLPGDQIAFDPTGNEVVFLHADFSVRGHDPQTGRVTRDYRSAAEDPVNRLEVTPDGRSVVLWYLQAALLAERASDAVVQHAFNPADSPFGIFHTVLGDLWAEQAAATRRLLLRTHLQAEPVITLDGPAEKLQAAVVSPDGRYLAAGGIDRIIYIWDLSTGDPPTKCIGHNDGCAGLTFSPDARTLVSHGNDYSVRFWHVGTGAELVKIGSRNERVSSMGLNPAGDLLVLGVEHHGRYGLQIHRLGPNRDLLPRTFEFLAPRADSP